MDAYTISKIRLIGFHNFVNETLTVPDGGHLFMLGDNGSGKTTVLDAVHLVLTAGRHEAMELNAAARVAGARHDGGRTWQGVVLRYNVERNGPLNPAGGIAYAALEITGRGGRPVSAAVGLAARSMEEAYESWAVLRDGPVDELPLLRTENGRTRPATRAELKEALGGRGFYGRVGAYTDELATRFFSDRRTYEDVCRFLATGKAYREIAMRTNDYHQLFRQLLQPPPGEIFEEVIRHLKTLEESRNDLARLRDKNAFVHELADLRARVRDLRIDQSARRWQACTLVARARQADLDRCRELLDAEQARLADLAAARDRLATSLEVTAQRLSELRHKDPHGLVDQEHRARLDLEAAQKALEAAQKRAIQAAQRAREAAQALQHEREALAKLARSTARDLQRQAQRLPFSAAALQSRLDDAGREPQPEATLGELPVADPRRAAEREGRELAVKLQAAEETLAEQDRALATLAAALEEKRRQGESLPRVAGFAEAQQRIQQQVLKARPLYKGLVPAPGATAQELAVLEQLVGEATLASWIVEPADADALRKLLLRDFPEQSLAVAGDDLDPVPADWLRRSFDLPRCDEAALLVLQHQVMAKAGPHVAKFLDTPVLHFRHREQAATRAAPRLIGEEIRRNELKREIDELTARHQAAAKTRKAQAQARDDLAAAAEAVASFRALLDVVEANVTRQREAVLHAVQSDALAANTLENARTEGLLREEEVQKKAARHEDVRILLRREKLEGLEERIQEIEKKEKRTRREHEDAMREIGRTENVVAAQKARFQALTTELLAANDARAAHEERLLALVRPDGPLDAFVAARCGAAADDGDALRQGAEAADREAAVLAERIRGKAVQNEGLAFGFVYDEPANTLLDRRGLDLDGVLAQSDRELKDQEELISERTRQLFQQLVMDKLVGTLQHSLRRMRELTHRIGTLLKSRSFGQNRYAFSVVPQDDCRRIHDLVSKYRQLDPSQTEQELRAFIEDHADEITGTEVGDIPRILDYRNWFRYELKVLTTGEDGVVMDRRIKSIGSGGEQAVPNYLLVLTVAHFLFDNEKVRLPVLLFDEAFYGIDAGRRDQILGFASDLGLQLLVASPDQDGVKKEIPFSTSVLVVKDSQCDVHLHAFHWSAQPRQLDLLNPAANAAQPVAFGAELPPPAAPGG